jgi:TP901 family phage tail tape measure protein
VAFSGHEMILVLRARDEASRVLRNLEGNIGSLSRTQQAAARRVISQGAALATVGIGIAAAGVAGLQFFGKATDAAMEYNRTVALTSTQTDKVKVSMKQLSDIGLMVARTIPVPFEQIQPMLYDIFSSMDVNTRQATRLLQSFSRAAVGGQVPLQEAGRATIAILNAYRLPAEKVNQVNDFMFQLVRKGVGTYHEFSTTIGRSIPSAVRAGQTYQALGGMLAFLTRNGLSTAMATASAGRALDAISNPKTVSKLKDFGGVLQDALGKSEATKRFGANFKNLSINIKDASGNFLPMTTIMKKLSDVLIGLPPPERAAVLYELFKGSGGTIQARRFFDIAIPGIRTFTQLTKDMYNNRGAAADAYQKMLATPAMQAQLFQNKIHALVVEIGTYLLPMKVKLIAIGNKLIDMWNSLSPSVRRTVVQIAAGAAVFAAILGVVVAAAGGILMLQGAFALMGTTLGAVLGPAAAIIAAIIAIGVALVYAYNHSTNFRNFVNNLGQAMVVAGKAIVAAVQAAFTWIVNTAIPWLKNAWNNAVVFILGAWQKMKDAWNATTSFISAQTHRIFDPVIAWLRSLLASFQDWYARHAEQLRRLWEYLTNAWKFLTQQFGRWILPYLQTLWNNLTTAAKTTWNILYTVIRGAWSLISNVLRAGFIWLRVTWNILWATLQASAKVAWSVIYNVIAIAWHIISGAFSVFLDLITGHWKTAWQDIKRAASDIWGNIKSMFSTWTSQSLNLLKTIGSNLLTGLKDGIIGGMRNIGGWIKGNVVDPVVNAVKNFFGIHSPSTVFAGIGGHLIQGLINGLTRTNPIQIVGQIFGGMPHALAAIVNKGLVSIAQLPGKALTALQGAGGWALSKLKAVGGLLSGLFGTGNGPSSGGNQTFGKGVSQWSTLVLQALTMLGQPASWLGTVLNRMQRESGGNPRAINLWDSNAKAGTPSMGLMQTIAPTFNAFAGPLRGRGIWDPLANIYAGLNYAIHRYGSLAALSRPGGYALGTLMARGVRWVGERGPELVSFGSGNSRVYNQGQPMPAVAGKTTTVNMTVYTNEIDPRAHGAALAWELATRVA